MNVIILGFSSISAGSLQEGFCLDGPKMFLSKHRKCYMISGNTYKIRLEAEAKAGWRYEVIGDSYSCL